MTLREIAVCSTFIAQVCFADGPFETGCKKATAEVMCESHQDCVMGPFMSKSKKGNDSEKGGYDECKEFAQFVKAQSVPLEAKRVITRLKSKIAAFNQEIKKDFPFLALTADFARLELEHKYKAARFMDNYGRDRTETSPIVGLARDDESKQFDLRYLNDLRSALYNVGKDQDGKDAMKAKFKEIRLGFNSHGISAFNPDIKVVDSVLIIPGVFTIDNTMYARDLEKFIEKAL
jgi:hypothetical protein